MLNTVKTSSDTVGLRKLYDYVLVNIRGIETLGVKKSSFSSMLCDILLRALPHDIVVQDHRTSRRIPGGVTADGRALAAGLPLDSVSSAATTTRRLHRAPQLAHAAPSRHRINTCFVS
ncbi:hypothetical protein HPB48_021331 [Haemaphysalis longicornis]|uniref:Uncharacterized protein n=1 Tax=Haemaphysalis longicornis TaxID=44386 RepID=A0A9J6FUP0_HAELO|nr:hypothetical protein HPB48_021331 [Haemaphysalis longicornis]